MIFRNQQLKVEVQNLKSARERLIMEKEQHLELVNETFHFEMTHILSSFHQICDEQEAENTRNHLFTFLEMKSLLDKSAEYLQNVIFRVKERDTLILDIHIKDFKDSIEKLRSAEQRLMKDLNDSHYHKESVHRALKDYTINLGKVLDEHFSCIHHSEKKNVNLDSLNEKMVMLQHLRTSGTNIIDHHSILDRRLLSQ